MQRRLIETHADESTVTVVDGREDVEGAVVRGSVDSEGNRCAGDVYRELTWSTPKQNTHSLSALGSYGNRRPGGGRRKVFDKDTLREYAATCRKEKNQPKKGNYVSAIHRPPLHIRANDSGLHLTLGRKTKHSEGKLGGRRRISVEELNADRDLRRGYLPINYRVKNPGTSRDRNKDREIYLLDVWWKI
jgi:hypothetical protein